MSSLRFCVKCISSLMPVNCVKSAKNFSLLPVCSYSSLLFINWFIKQSKSLFISSIQMNLFTFMNYCFCLIWKNVETVKCKQCCFPSGGSENPFPCLLQLLEAAYSPWLMAPSSMFKISSLASFQLSDLCFQPFIFSNFDPPASFFFEFYFIYFFIQQVLISYPFYTYLVYICQSQSPKLDMISILNVLRLSCGLICDLSWRMLHVQLKRMCILLFWSGMFYMYLLSPYTLMCCLRPMFPYWFSVWMIYPLM